MYVQRFPNILPSSTKISHFVDVIRGINQHWIMIFTHGPRSRRKKGRTESSSKSLSITRSRERIRRNKIVLRYVNECRMSRQAD